MAYALQAFRVPGLFEVEAMPLSERVQTPVNTPPIVVQARHRKQPRSATPWRIVACGRRGRS